MLQEFIASSAETGVEFETEVLGEDVISTRLATVLLFGSVGALAGQVAESLDADDSEKGQGFDPIGLYTPGERREGTVLKGRVSLEDDRMASAVGMGFRKFSRELRELVRTAFGSNVAAPKMSELTKNLNLSNDAVWEREYSREQVHPQCLRTGVPPPPPSLREPRLQPSGPSLSPTAPSLTAFVTDSHRF